MTTTKNGHDVIYQTFSISERDYNTSAIIGVWRCEETGRFLILYLVYVDARAYSDPIPWLGTYVVERLKGVT